jgi:hypothetical protein
MFGEVRLCLACGVFSGSQKIVGFLGCSTKPSMTVCWFGHKTNTEPGRCGGQVMNGIGVEAAPRPQGLWQFTTKPPGLLG